MIMRYFSLILAFAAIIPSSAYAGPESCDFGTDDAAQVDVFIQKAENRVQTILDEAEPLPAEPKAPASFPIATNVQQPAVSWDKLIVAGKNGTKELGPGQKDWSIMIVDGEKVKIVSLEKIVPGPGRSYRLMGEITLEVIGSGKKIKIRPNELAAKFALNDKFAQSLTIDDWYALNKFNDSLASPAMVKTFRNDAIAAMKANMSRFAKGQCNVRIELCMPSVSIARMNEMLPFLASGEDIAVRTMSGLEVRGKVVFASKLNEGQFRIIDTKTGSVVGEVGFGEVSRVSEHEGKYSLMPGSTGVNVNVTSADKSGRIVTPLLLDTYHTPTADEIAANIKALDQFAGREASVVYTDGKNIFRQEGRIISSKSKPDLDRNFLWIDVPGVADYMKINKTDVLGVVNPHDPLIKEIVEDTVDVAHAENVPVKVVFNRPVSQGYNVKGFSYDNVENGMVLKPGDPNYPTIKLEGMHLKPEDVIVIVPNEMKPVASTDAHWYFGDQRFEPVVIDKNFVTEIGVSEAASQRRKVAIGAAESNKPKPKFIEAKTVTPVGDAQVARKPLLLGDKIQFTGRINRVDGTYEMKVIGAEYNGGELKMLVVEFVDGKGIRQRRSIKIDQLKDYFLDGASLLKREDFASFTNKDWITLDERMRGFAQLEKENPNNPGAKDFARKMKLEYGEALHKRGGACSIPLVTK